MHEVTRLIEALSRGDAQSADQLLPLVYDELRTLAAQKLAREAKEQTLQPTALVHEAYLRLVGSDQAQKWDGRRHFFAAAAEAMRRILIEQARRRMRIKHGGEFNQIELTDELAGVARDPARLLELDAALGRLAEEDPVAAEVVKLHFFSGHSLEEVAEIMRMSRATAYRQWAYARSWLKCELT